MERLFEARQTDLTKLFQARQRLIQLEERGARRTLAGHPGPGRPPHRAGRPHADRLPEPEARTCACTRGRTRTSAGRRRPGVRAAPAVEFDRTCSRAEGDSRSDQSHVRQY